MATPRPRRSNFGSRDDGGHLEYRQAINAWNAEQNRPAPVAPPIAPPVASPVAPPVTPSVAPPLIQEVLPPNHPFLGGQLTPLQQLQQPPQQVMPPQIRNPASDFGGQLGPVETQLQPINSGLAAGISPKPTPLIAPAQYVSPPSRGGLGVAGSSDVDGAAFIAPPQVSNNAEIISPPQGIRPYRYENYEINEDGNRRNHGLVQETNQPPPPVMQPPQGQGPMVSSQNWAYGDPRAGTGIDPEAGRFRGPQPGQPQFNTPNPPAQFDPPAPAPAPASNFSKIWEDSSNPVSTPQYGDSRPVRGNYGSSDEGGHIEYKEDLNAWNMGQNGSQSPTDTTINQSYPPAPVSNSLPFSSVGGQTRGSYHGGIAPQATNQPPQVGTAVENLTTPMADFESDYYNQGNQGRRYIQAPQEPQSMPNYDPYQGRTPGFGLPGTGMFSPTTPYGVRGIGNTMGTGRYGMPPPMMYPMQPQMGYGSPFGQQSMSPMSGKGGPSQAYSPPPPRPYFGSNTGFGGNRGFGGKAGRSQAPPPPPPRPSFSGNSGKGGRSQSPFAGSRNPWGSSGSRSMFKQGGQFSSAFEGLVPGSGGGMDDIVSASIEGREPILVSRDEYIIPADAVSDIGDGSTGRGAELIDNMVSGIRLAKNGSQSQPRSMQDISRMI